MKPKSRHILLLGVREEVFGSVYQTLFRVFDGLRWPTKMHFQSEDALRDLEDSKRAYPLFAIDPSQPEWNPQRWREMTSRLGSKLPRILLFSSATNRRILDMEEMLDADGRVDASLTPYEMAYIVTRLLYPNLKNHRKYPRVPANLPCRYLDASAREWKPAAVLTLGEGGAFINIPFAPRSKKPISVRLSLPDGESDIECVGQVTYAYHGQVNYSEIFPSGAGIRFKKVPPSGQERINHYVRTRMIRIDQKISLSAPPP